MWKQLFNLKHNWLQKHSSPKASMGGVRVVARIKTEHILNQAQIW